MNSRLLLQCLSIAAIASACTALSTGAADDEASPSGAAYAMWDASGRSKEDISSLPEPATTQKGSELCGANLYTCMPDNLTGCVPDAGAPTDAGAAPLDGGSTPSDASADTDAGIVAACRVTQHAGDAGATCTTAGGGQDGAECRTPADCAAGFECVGDPGQCRRYCCLGSSSCAADRVCDKQMVTGEQLWVPVCIPIHACKLLDEKGCPAKETCGIVDQVDGKTSCVAVGTAGAGESCELTNCAANHTCLGSPNERTCFKLCTKSGNDCPANHECKGQTPLFQNPDHGICLPKITGGAGNAWK